MAFARALRAAARNWALYPSEHPAVGAAVRRLAEAVRPLTAGAAFSCGITPKTLLVAGLPLSEETSVAEVAQFLHERDLLQLTLIGDVSTEALEALLGLLAMPVDELRRQGGPAKVWEAAGQASIALEQIDYEKLLEDRDVDEPADRDDDVWRSLVNTMLHEQDVLDERQQRRLLRISRSAADIGKLTLAVTAPQCSIDGSPLVVTQAATVVAVFRRLTGLVEVMEPERLAEVMQNLAAATTSLDPNVAVEVMLTRDGFHERPIIEAIAASFNDDTVAGLLAQALTRDRRVTARLAQVFGTIVPDDERKRRVLAMARSMLSEQDFGAAGQFSTAWTAMEQLLLTYDDTPYVSASYQASLDGVGERAELLAARGGLPPELPEWMDTLQPDNVRASSVVLISDLLRIEDDRGRAAEIVQDMAVLVEDLLLAGDFQNSAIVLRELRQATDRKTIATAARHALAATAASTGLRDAAALLADLDAAGLQLFTECCELVGPGAVVAFLPTLQSESTAAPAFRRARGIVERFGADAIEYLSPLIPDNRWFVQRNAALLLGATRSAAAVPSLELLLQQRHADVLRQAVAALAGIDDPSAARGIRAVLHATTGATRAAVVEALVAERDPRVVPMLARVLTDSDPFGEDYQTVLDALAAIAQLGGDSAVSSVAVVMRGMKLFARKRARVLKRTAVKTLVTIGTPKAQAALDDAARTGDRLLKRIIRAARGPTHPP
ncbi:MAG: HEAT repeat domain-containing protein [Acidobacteria bacterium]|nr:HEAT repeat domain-containing protein [Acidobacteriota bacterium]